MLSRVLALALCGTLLAATATKAQDAPSANPLDAAPSQQSPIELFGETLIFFLPDWTDGLSTADVMNASTVDRQENSTQFLIEMVPSEQTLEEWRDIFAILAQKGDVSVASELDTIEANYMQGCDPARTLVVRSDRVENPPTDGSGYATVFCGAYAADSAQGEIGVFRVVRQGDVTARIYREWRGPAFDLADRANFPVSVERLRAINERMLATGFAGE